MSNELHDWVIWLLAIANLMQAIYLVRLRRAVRTLESGHLKAVAVRADAEQLPESGRRLRVVPAWFGLAGIVAVARWIGKRPGTSALALVGVVVAPTAIVLLPQIGSTPPLAAPAPVTVTRTQPQHPAAHGPTAPLTTAPPATSSAPLTTSRQPPSTPAATTTTPSTTAQPSGTPLSSTVPLPATIAATPATTAATTAATTPVPSPEPLAEGGKPDKGQKRAPVNGSASALSVSVDTPPRHRGVCLRLLFIELGDCGT